MRRIFMTGLCASALGLALAAPASAAPGDLTLRPGPEACLHPQGLENCIDAQGTQAIKPYAISPDGAHLYGGNTNGLFLVDRAADGSLAPRDGLAGCYVDNATEGCTAVTGQNNATDVAVAPGGGHVYATSSFSDSIVTYNRAADGTLARKPLHAGCTADVGSIGCADGRALDVPIAVEVSPGGGHVYVLSQGTNDGIAVFDRAPDGTLTQKAGASGCTTQTGAEGCTDGRNLGNPSELVLSADGKTLYATGSGISVFDVAADGTITQKAGTDGCVNNSGSDGCATGRGLSTVVGIAISADGTRGYAAAQGSSAITTFDRAADGRLTQRDSATSCVQHDGAPAITDCTSGRALQTVKSPVLSPDGAQLYAATQNSFGVVVLDVAPDGNPVQRPGAKGCITHMPTADCGVERGLFVANTTLMAPDGRRLYVSGSALVAFDRQVDPDPTVLPPAPGPAGPVPGATPAPGPSVPVALCNRPLTLLDVLARPTKRVRITGIARTTFAGQRVILRDGSRRVGSAVISKDGRFAATVKAPSANRRAKVRFTATLPNGTRSQAFKLQRQYTIVSRKNVKGGVRVVVRLNGRRRSPVVRVQRQTSCTDRRNVATRRINKKGEITVTLPRPTDPADPVAIYRVRARVNKQFTFTLQVAVERAR